MTARAGHGLGATERLRRAADFRRVLRDGRRVEGRLLSLVAAPNRSGHARLGLAASRRIGGAVERNRAKRLVRESFRRHDRHAPLDLVALPKVAIRGCTLAAVEAEFLRLIARLRRRSEHARRESPAPAAD